VHNECATVEEIMRRVRAAASPASARTCCLYEVPISYAGREVDEGKKITWRDGFGAMKALIRLGFAREY
jgi:hypothetical protein